MRADTVQRKAVLRRADSAAIIQHAWRRKQLGFDVARYLLQMGVDKALTELPDVEIARQAHEAHLPKRATASGALDLYPLNSPLSAFDSFGSFDGLAEAAAEGSPRDLEACFSAAACVRLSHSATRVSHCADWLGELSHCVSCDVDMPTPRQIASGRMSPCVTAMLTASFIAMTALKMSSPMPKFTDGYRRFYAFAAR